MQTGAPSLRCRPPPPRPAGTPRVKDRHDKSHAPRSNLLAAAAPAVPPLAAQLASSSAEAPSLLSPESRASGCIVPDWTPDQVRRLRCGACGARHGPSQYPPPPPQSFA